MLKERTGGGIEACGIELDMLGHAADVCMLADDAEASSELVNSVADETGQKADVAVNVPETDTTFVHGNFETSRGLAMHRRKWRAQAAAVEDDVAVSVVEGHDVGKMAGVRGPPDGRWHCVEWAGFDDTAEKLHGTDPGDAWPSDWEPTAHVEGAMDVDGNVATDVFWGRKKNTDEAGDHQDEDEPRCPHCDGECESQRGARLHQRKAKCRPTSDFVPKKARRAVVRGKTKGDAGKLDEVCVGGEELKMVTASRCLGSMIEHDSDTDLDVDAWLAVARSTFNQLHPLWKSTTLSARVKLNLFRVSVGMMARHRSEAWTLDEKTLKKLRGWCSSCLVCITGRTHREEAGADSSFDVAATIRAQRLKCLGNVLHLSDDESVKIVVPKPAKPEDGERPAGSMFVDAGACGRPTTLRPRQRRGRVGQTRRRHLPDEEARLHRAACLKPHVAIWRVGARHDQATPPAARDCARQGSAWRRMPARPWSSARLALDGDGAGSVVVVVVDDDDVARTAAGKRRCRAAADSPRLRPRRRVRRTRLWSVRPSGCSPAGLSRRRSARAPPRAPCSARAVAAACRATAAFRGGRPRGSRRRWRARHPPRGVPGPWSSPDVRRSRHGSSSGWPA